MKIEKKRYEKPMIRRIELVAEEVLATGCKFSYQGSAPLSMLNCTGNSCSQPGS